MFKNNMQYLKAVDSFKKYLAIERGYSQLTIKEYDKDLMLFYNYLTEEQNLNKNFSLHKIDKFKTAEFLSDVILKYDNAPVTRNRKLYSLRSFYKYLIKKEIIEKDPTRMIEASKTQQQTEPIYLQLDDSRKYIETIKDYNSINKYRDLAIVKIFLYAGLRVSELVNLNLTDINPDDQSIKFYGKGQKERYVPLHHDVIRSIKAYLKERNEIKAKNEDAKKALFLSRHGRRISARSVQLMVKKYAKKAGVKKANEITPHKLRHTFASLLYRQTKDIRVLQELLGHASISTTQIYTHTDTEQRKSAIDEFPEI